MAKASERLATSLEVLRDLQQQGKVALNTDHLSTVHRRRLEANGFIKEVYRGWYIISSPTEREGDSTSWYSSYWLFCAQYLTHKYGNNWCISPEQSLLLHAGNWTVPKILVIKSPEANNFTTTLPFTTSLFHAKSPLPEAADIVEMQGLRVLSLVAALAHTPQQAFIKNATDVRTAMALVKDASEVNALVLETGKSVVAGRLAGAFRNNHQPRIADDIMLTMKSAGYDIRETDPFDKPSPITLPSRERSPYGNRIRQMWHEWRTTVMAHFPPAPGLPTHIPDYIQRVDEIFVTDAYHSLSIEKYVVSPELIERVRTGKWNVNKSEVDQKHRDAMAAKGYWDAFKVVKSSVAKVLTGTNAGTIADDEHGSWYRALFAPSVSAGILKASDLSGYRAHQVYISRSKHVPLNKEAVRDAMPVLFELLAQEPEASVRAVLGHFILVYIHPYMDGNGRIGRFLMNVMLASGGYPWTVVPVEQRDVYMQALEQASVHNNIEPFAAFTGYLVSESLKGTPVATKIEVDLTKL